MASKGVLLMNLGSPDSTAVPDVGVYLREFLMDGRVIDAPFPIRWFIVNCMILPSRPKESAHAYASVWTEEGSPLIVTSRNVQRLLREKIDVPVELCMRYQNPTPQTALESLQAKGVADVHLIPLFPHFAMSSYETAVERVKEVVAGEFPGLSLSVEPPYYKDPDYIAALVDSMQEYLSGEFDLLLFSFHGIPERHLRKSDPSGSHCLSCENCCSGDHPSHATCYRAQCFKTAEMVAEQAGIPREKFHISFQSRLGRDPWLKPYTDFELERFAKEGKKRILAICPAFVSDCLETIEEIGMRGKATFEENGGENLTLIPCLNEHPRWIETLAAMCRRFIGD